MKKQFVVLEFDIKVKDDRRATIFGPFDSEIEAKDFCNRRIALLASEWDAKEDGVVTENLTWLVRKCCNVS